MSRNSKGSLVTWLLLLAIIGLVLVLGLIFMEFLIRWVSLARVQNAVKETALVYARDMVRLRDNRLSMVAPGTTVNFQTAGLPPICSISEAGTNPAGCTPLVGSKAAIPGAVNLENLNASQVFLYNIWGSRARDASAVNDVRQTQCYKSYQATRFSLNPGSALSNCAATGKVTSPIMGLTWKLEAAPYGTGVCCSADGTNTDKDFCVLVSAKGRMDPIMAGGLPFLQGVDFIKVGSFNISARATVKKMNASGSAASDSAGVAKDLSGETISLESGTKLPAGTTCPAPPPYTPPSSPYTPPVSPPPIIDPPTPDPPDDPPPGPSPTTPPPCEAPAAECPAGFSPSAISQGSCDVTYTCVPPTPPDPRKGCADYLAQAASNPGLPLPDGCEIQRSPLPNRANCAIYNGEVVSASYDPAYKGALYEGPDAMCFCPLVISLGNSLPQILLNKGINYSFDGKSVVASHWLKPSPQNGFLVLDLNHNGMVDNGTELLGQHTGGGKFSDGYKALAKYKDKNGDGLINKLELRNILFWSDLNFDGKSQASELKPLTSLGITELNIKPNSLIKQNLQIEGGSLYPYVSRGYTAKIMNNKLPKVGSTYDVWFAPFNQVAYTRTGGNPNEIGF